MTVPRRAVCLYADGAQNSAHFDRGIARYVVEHARAIYDVDPGALQWILLNPGLPLPGSLSPLFGTGLLTRNHPCAGWGAEQRPLIYHVMSPFESTPIDILWPPWARDSRIATVVTLYDLIPLLFADQYLGDPAFRADYHARLEFIRHADYVLAISQTTANDAVEHLELDPRRVGVIHAGASTRFVSPYPSPMAALDQLARELRSIRPGFILYVGGFDFRKNL
jgi:glycosyltransferase involved in cell wall biosynthesis